MLVEKYNGEFFYSLEEVMDLFGIGWFIVGVIFLLFCNMCFFILDGNVKCVLVWYYVIGGWLG